MGQPPLLPQRASVLIPFFMAPLGHWVFGFLDSFG